MFRKCLNLCEATKLEGGVYVRTGWESQAVIIQSIRSRGPLSILLTRSRRSRIPLGMNVSYLTIVYLGGEASVVSQDAIGTIDVRIYSNRAFCHKHTRRRYAVDDNFVNGR